MLLADETHVGLLKVRGAPRDDLALRLALTNLLRGTDAHPGAAPPAALVVVRRLADPSPGRLSPRRDGRRGDPAWERAVQAALAECYMRAARPAHGPVSATADVVVFADPAEMLACLARDLRAGEAGTRWWWRSVLRALPSAAADALVSVWSDEAAYVPAALHLLAARGEAGTVLRGVTPRGALTILAAVAAAFNVPALVPGSGATTYAGRALSDGPDVARDHRPAREPRREAPEPSVATDARSSPPWGPWVPSGHVPRELHREARCLLGVGLTLHRAPAAARSSRFAADLSAWWTREASDPRGGPRADSALADDSPGIGGLRARRDSLPQHGAAPLGKTEGEVADDANAVNPLSAERAEAVRERAIVGSPPASTRRSDDPRAGGDHDRPRPRRHDGVRQEASSSHPLVAGPLSDDVDTRLGGVLYLVTLMRRLDLPACFEELALEVGAWGVLELLGRALLADEPGDLTGDPLWPALGRLAGREAGTLPGVTIRGDDAFRLPAAWRASTAAHGVPRSRRRLRGPLVAALNAGARRWLGLVLPYVRRDLDRAVGTTEAGPPNLAGVLLLRPARIRLTSSHVDVVMALDSVSLPVRRAGLDGDPGWAPEFGRVIRFHFQ